jgi:hypothetical protein
MANPNYGKRDTEFLLISGKLNNRQKQMRLGKLSPDEMVLSTLVVAENVDFDNNGETSQRLGRVVAYAGVPHSFWTHPHNDSIGYFVEAGVLMKLNADFSATAVVTLPSNSQMRFVTVNQEIVCSNGEVIGWLNDTTFTPFAKELTQFEKRTPAGQYLSFFRGVLYVASGDVFYASKPWNIEVMDERYCHFPMAGRIRMLSAVEDGIWISTDRELGFISGKGTDKFEFNHRTHSVCPDGAFIEEVEETEDSVAQFVTWVSEEGFCQGTDGGEYRNLSGNDVALPNGETGHLFRVFNNGIRQYVAVIHGPEYTRTYTLPDLETNELTI